MLVDIDSFQKITITGLDISDAEILSDSIQRIIEDLPKEKQPRFRKLLIHIDKLLPREYDTTENH